MKSLCLQSWHFDGQSLGSLKWAGKICLVPKTLINLLLLNSNNLTHWSRECPICFLWGSVSFPARADSVIRDDGREAGGARTFNVTDLLIEGTRVRGPRSSQSTAPNHSGLSVMWGHKVRFSRLWMDSANLYWVPMSGTDSDKVPPSLATDN